MRSLRAFVISFVLSLTVFGILAYNIVGNVFNIRFYVPAISDKTVETEDVTEDPTKPIRPTKPNVDSDDTSGGEVTGSEQLDDLELPEGKESEATFLFVTTDYQPSVFDYNKSGYDEDGLYIPKKKVLAESLLLVKIDRETKTFMFSSIPGNTVMNKTTNKTVGELYNEKGAGYMVDCVYALTGIQVEHLAVIGIDDCLKVFKKLGNITYNIPCNMSYVDENRKIEFDLQAGLQNMTPEMIMQMLRFDEYSDDNIYTRESVHVDFSQALFKKFTSPAYLSKAVDLFKSIIGYFETNFDETDFNNNMDLIFSFQKYQSRIVTYPGFDNEINGELVFVPSTGEAISAFEEYK